MPCSRYMCMCTYCAMHNGHRSETVHCCVSVLSILTCLCCSLPNYIIKQFLTSSTSHADSKEFLLIQKRKPDGNGAPLFCSQFSDGLELTGGRHTARRLSSAAYIFFLSGQSLGRQQFNFSLTPVC
jgi:hypothetical protein